jgi:hypothetical protein
MMFIIVGHLACSDPASDYAAASLNSSRPPLAWVQESTPPGNPTLPGEGNRHGVHLDPPLRGMSATDFQPMVGETEEGRLTWRAATAT